MKEAPPALLARGVRKLLHSPLVPVVLVLGLYVWSELLDVGGIWSRQTSWFFGASVLTWVAWWLGVIVAIGLALHAVVRAVRKDRKGSYALGVLLGVTLIPIALDNWQCYPVSNLGHRARFDRVGEAFNLALASQSSDVELPWGNTAKSRWLHGCTTYNLYSDRLNTAGLVHSPSPEFFRKAARMTELSDAWWLYIE